MVVFSLLVVAIAYVGPFQWLRGQANTASTEATALKDQNAELQPKISNAEKAKNNEAAYNERLAQVRAVLPELPEDIASPLIRVVSDAAIENSVLVGEQDLGTSPLPPVAKAGEAASAAPTADGAAADPNQPKSYSVSLTADGTLNGVVGFVSTLSNSGRLYVYNVEIKPSDAVGAAKDFSTNFDDPGNLVTATISFRAYASPNATATGPAPGK
jgi:hypothetical protein